MAGKNIYNNAVERIKAAILKSQYTAAKQVNAIQLSYRIYSRTTEERIAGTERVQRKKYT